MKFKPDQAAVVLALGKSRYEFFPMLPDPFRQIGSDADMKNAVSAIGNYVCARIAILHGFVLEA